MPSKRPSLWILLSLSVFALALSLAPLFAQDQPPTDDTGGGMDPVTTPAPLPTRMPRPAVYLIAQDGDTELHFYFQVIPQGETGLARVVGEGIASVRARWLDQLIDFYPMPDGLYGLLAAGMETPTGRTTPLDVFVTKNDGTRVTLNTTVEIVLGSFITQDVIIPPDKGALLDTETERNELARLESLAAASTLERYWDENGFQLPILAALTSPFGAFRSFNGTLNTRHTGWDIRTTLGTPVMASAAGRVVYAGRMDIRGNYIFIDHGYGVYSGYAHFSVMHVTRGQMVEKGQIIGLSGDTGRTSGPHFHWEMTVNGNWVDSVQFLEMWQP
jgi:murein DD-endopeptidase MepM/ murein hydrolase activator NlpD